MEVQIAAAKINKYAVSESGDTLEVVERPDGEISVVLADGQTSGRSAKAISIMVAHKVIGLLAEGARDGAAARAASEYLFAKKNGEVSSTLNIISVDLRTKTVLLTQNNPAPVFIMRGEQLDRLEANSQPLGMTPNTRPAITEIPLEAGLTVVACSDGLIHAGEECCGQPMDVSTTLRGLLDESDPSPQEIADALLAQAVRLDDGRPADDISVVVLRVMPRKGDDVRRITMRIPIESG
jgi:serine phosphatase RsbU (regulator of sigma subunit)